MTNDLLSTPQTIQSFYAAYVRILGDICDAAGIKRAYINVSSYALCSVASEVKRDIKALRMRRSLSHGVSSGKIAGAVAFRLTKARVLALSSEIIEDSLAQTLEINVAIAMGLELVETNFSIWPKNLLRELKFFLAKRHSNQESLGICFDTFACSTPRQQTK